MTEQEYIDRIIAEAKKQYRAAISNFPQPNYVLLKVAEEAGEVVQAGVHYAEGREAWGQLEIEVTQTIAMCLRLLVEGDKINGIIPPHGLGE